MRAIAASAITRAVSWLGAAATSSLTTSAGTRREAAGHETTTVQVDPRPPRRARGPRVVPARATSEARAAPGSSHPKAIWTGRRSAALRRHRWVRRSGRRGEPVPQRGAVRRSGSRGRARRPARRRDRRPAPRPPAGDGRQRHHEGQAEAEHRDQAGTASSSRSEASQAVAEAGSGQAQAQQPAGPRTIDAVGQCVPTSYAVVDGRPRHGTGPEPALLAVEQVGLDRGREDGSGRTARPGRRVSSSACQVCVTAVPPSARCERGSSGS